MTCFLMAPLHSIAVSHAQLPQNFDVHIIYQQTVSSSFTLRVSPYSYLLVTCWIGSPQAENNWQILMSFVTAAGILPILECMMSEDSAPVGCSQSQGFSLATHARRDCLNSCLSSILNHSLLFQARGVRLGSVTGPDLTSPLVMKSNVIQALAATLYSAYIIY